MQTDVQPTGDSLLANTTSSDESISVASTAPGQLRVIKRNGAFSLLTREGLRSIRFSQRGNPPKAVTFSETNFIGFHSKLPSNVKAIHYILCFCGWTLIVFLGLAGIPLNNYGNNLKIVTSIKCFSYYYLFVNRNNPHNCALYLVIS